MSSNAGWSGLWLAADAIFLFWVLGWTLLSDLDWTGGRPCLLLKLLCLEVGSYLSLVASLMMKRGSHSPSPLVGVVSHTVTGGADLVLMLEPWLPSSMGSALIPMWALLSCWSLDALSGNDCATWIGCQQWAWGMRTLLGCQRPGCQIWGEPEEVEHELDVLGYLLMLLKLETERHESSWTLEWWHQQRLLSLVIWQWWAHYPQSMWEPHQHCQP